MTPFIKSAIVVPKAVYFEIETGLERSAVRDSLEANVVKPLPFNLPKFWSSKFVGDVYSSEFDIKINVWYNLGYDPVFRGIYRNTDRGGVVGVKASNYYAVFATVMMWIACAVALYFTFSSALHGHYRSAGILAAVASGIAANAIFIGVVYHRTVREGRRKLELMLGKKDLSI